ncbi:MAG: Na/Pi symporter [Candidatus Ancaeobacter aquaticus]|nr:Na/Pi symporter [Candidatus Ancaeobacter aquaticus]
MYIKNEHLNTIIKSLCVVLFLYLFLISIGMMGAAFKGFGEGFAEHLIQTTSNPFVGLFIGVLATSVIQSSSTTTSMVVGMVGGGVLTVTNAVPIIMGANIGTTVTNTIVSLGHVTRREEFKRAIAGATVHDFFNMICVAIMFPLELATGFLQKTATWMSTLFAGVGGTTFNSPIKAITKPVINMIKHALIDLSGDHKKTAYVIMLALSFALLFLALYFIVKLMKSLVVNKVENSLDKVLGKSGIIAIIAGVIFTILVQSSSITTSLLIPLVAAGIMNIETIFPLTMGANIGTTTTSILAAFATGNVSAIIIAFVHFLFNMIGVTVLYPIQLFRKIPIRLAKSLGELAYRKRGYAILYVVTLFFIVPGILIFITEYFK